MTQVPLAPPPPSNDSTQDRWLYLLWKRLTATGQILWETIGFTGSDLTDIATRNHADLQNLNADDHTQYLLADGTRGLSANWDAGSVEIRAQTFESDVATGTAPLVIASTTKVDNLHVARATLADTVTVSDAASDSTCWILVAGSQTGDLQVFSDSGFTYNANTGAMTITSSGTLLFVKGSGTQYNGITNQMTDASGSAQRTFFVETVNESNIAVASILMNSATDGSSSVFFQITPSGSRSSDRRELSLTINDPGVYMPAGATNMTKGFIHIPSAAGAPTGAPTNPTGNVPMYYDTTNNHFYVYNGAWKKVALT